MKRNLVLVQPVASFENDFPVLPQDAVGIGMLTIISYVGKFGYSGEIVHIPNALSQGLSLSSIIAHIRDCDPDVIGIGLNWLHFSKGALEAAKIFRQSFPNKVIVIGGQHATLFVKSIVLSCPDITGITIGESEITYCKLLDAVTMNLPIESVPGLAFIDNHGYHESSPIIVEDLDTIPFYSYRNIWPETKTECAALDTVRGTCPKNCPYCIESKTNTLQGRMRFSHHSPEYLARQIEVFVSDGISSVTIQDPVTLLGETFLTRVCEAILDHKIKLTLLNLFVEPHLFSNDFFTLLCNCADRVVLDYGIESGSYDVLRLSDRLFSKELLLENFKQAIASGIKILTWWMVGMPGETKETIDETFQFMAQTVHAGALPRWVTPLILFPQTDMANDADKYGITNIYKSFDDYSNFSDERANKYGIYEELITHTPKGLNTTEIIELTISLKKGIQFLLTKNMKSLIKLGWDRDFICSILTEVGGSFF